MGTVYAFGYNNGTFGNNDLVSVSSPIIVNTQGWFQLPVGGISVFAIGYDNNLYSCGSNTNGQLAIGSVVSQSSFIQVTFDGSWQSVKGGYSFIALKNDGSIWGWGNNSNGQCGLGDTIPRSSMVQIGTSTDWASISNNSAGNVTAAIKKNGTLWCWGSNIVGGYGNNSTAYASSPIQVGTASNWSQVVCGDASFAIKTDGTLWSTGWGSSGSTGRNTTVDSSSWVQIGSGSDWYMCDTTGGSPLALKKNGTLWVWGGNFAGQIGNNTTVNVSSPVQVAGSWTMAASSGSGYIGIKNDGTCWCWGTNSSGQIGQGNVANYSSPVQVLGGVSNLQIGYGSLQRSFVQSGVTSTPTMTPSPTPSASPSGTPSPTPSFSPNPSPTPSESPSPTPSDTPSPSPSESPTPTPTPSDSPMPTAMPIPSLSPTATPGPVTYQYYFLIDCARTYNKIGRSTKTPAEMASTPNWFVGPNLCFTIAGYDPGPAYDYDLDASTSAPVNGCTDPLCNPPAITPTAATNFVTNTLLPNADGYDFYNQGTGMGNLALTFQNSSSSAQAVFVSLFNQSNQTMIISVNGVNYPVYAGQSFSQTITLKAGNFISISSAIPSLYTAATVFGQIYVARNSGCAYIAKLTPTTRAVEGDEGSLDTSVINGVSQQRNAYITITENGDQVKVIETSVDDNNCFNTNIQGLPDVMPLVCSGCPQY
jgi:alpha-tubulin suppressor-like RCC1 family protein